jgi:hypothetical protein
VTFADHVAVEQPIAAVAKMAAKIAEDLIVLEILEPTFKDDTLMNAPIKMKYRRAPAAPRDLHKDTPPTTHWKMNAASESPQPKDSLLRWPFASVTFDYRNYQSPSAIAARVRPLCGR